jgi:hypothetical protein
VIGTPLKEEIPLSYGTTTFQNALSGKADASDLTGLLKSTDLPNLIDVPAEATEAIKTLIETDGSRKRLI